VQQARIKELEAELGLPVMMVGNCYNCHKPLGAGARFCNSCDMAAEKPTTHICLRPA
jgi:hypothetical protein